MEMLCTTTCQSSKKDKYVKVKFEGHDFVDYVLYDNLNNNFLDHYYNIIKKCKVKSLNYQCIKIKVYGTNSIRPHIVTVTRFDTGQFVSSYH